MRLKDAAARVLITTGGIGTIVAVATVCLFLVAVVLPLFLPARVDDRKQAPLATAGTIVRLAVDEYLTTGYTFTDDGVLTAFRLDDGTPLATIPLHDGERTPTAWSFSTAADVAVIGYDDGRVQSFRIDFETSFVLDDDVPDALLELEEGEAAPDGPGTVQRTPEGQFRRQRLVVEPLGDARQIAAAPVTRLHHASVDGSLTIVALTDDPRGRLVLLNGEQSESVLTGRATFRYGGLFALPYDEHDGRDAEFARVAGNGVDVYLAWTDGHFVRLDASDPTAPVVAETGDLVPRPGATLTSLDFLLGSATLIVGDSDGGLGGWFLAPDLTHAKHFPAQPAPVTAVATGTRRRLFATGTAHGDLDVWYMTSAERLASVTLDPATPINALAIAPKENALLAAADGAIHRWSFDPRYPEASFELMFAPVWYEGYEAPMHSWQSSSASDDAEPNLGLVPLIFGSIKATVYSLLFGAPLALLAAIYTSEFLDPRWKAWIKPIIEMMASLPSVVLGFLAALVVAPYIEQYVPAALAAFVTVPLVFVVGAFLWQMLPRPFTIPRARHRVVFVAALLPVGVLLAIGAGPLVEALLFGGDLKGWLNGLHLTPTVGRPLGGWVLLLLPAAAMAVAFTMTQWLGPALRRRTGRFHARHASAASLATFLIGVLGTVAVVLAAGTLLGAVGLDVRKPLPFVGSFLDTFDQRNALVVGFIMGFAIIPIIYTIADDALSTVPEHLRSASLGAGATPWQTAVRIIIPTAMSGLFSAMMIGLGRAVGETMIVLMAAGNTPVMSMNMFEGFRTLSANIAVELPEAPIGGTHYRTLFLAALTLFAITFVINTVAEAVRLRFRRRAYQL